MRVISRLADWVTTPYTVLLLLRDPAIPRPVKLRAFLLLAAVFAYIISPIDLFPDLQPFIGWLDDLVVVPVGMSLADRFVPGGYIAGKREVARARVRRASFLAAGMALGVVVAWGLLLAGLVYIAVKLAAS